MLVKVLKWRLNYWRSNMNIDEFSYHEVLDRASILADSWEDQITHHSGVIA